ncbi:hypothetical protein JTE90_021533 [Oedothorax gibbosus]|uniref:von Hippel-Lindau disease tumour suppressor beta domain-containing protein n=1 Tax=Oedothorax gibbosus TaxID=931172 RepID=A0AAV6VRA5_9ARAC|nr:hypothetical protein JTE90_021533 [Oedothorax gibbosus]
MARVVSGFRSGPSRKACWLQIVNRTSRQANIIWVDYYGRETNYGMVLPRSIKSIHSYEGHPWLCRDAISKKRLLLNNDETFVPSCPDEPDPNDEVQSLPIIVVNISLPLFTLQDISADIVSKCLSNEKDIWTLDLPIKLKDLIVNCYRNVNS